ncbi:MAG: hypothetical protein ABRQ35_11185 [Smithellaceae bacterium]
MGEASAAALAASAAAAAAAVEPEAIFKNKTGKLMTKIPDQPQDIFVPLTQDYLKVFGNELISLIIYGSAAGGYYIRGKSDINLLVVLTPAGLDKFTDVLETVQSWRKRSVAIPLIMSKNFVESSLDSYPIEFLGMKNSHILIYGEDILAELTVKPADLRLQIERELRSKLLLLREGYLEAEGKPRRLRSLISRSLTAFLAIFNALLYYKTGKMQQGRREIIKEMRKTFTMDASVFLFCADIKEGKDKFSGAEVTDIFRKYFQEINDICKMADQL